MFTEATFTTAEAHSVLSNYFQAINSKSYEVAAALFCENGTLVAPLGICIEGRQAIATYLEEKCQGMQLLPEHCTTRDEVWVVVGRVRTPAFSVNVEWTFYLADNSIQSLRVRLLASLKELAHLRESHQA